MASATDPPLAIVGTGRSGSGYISTVLTSAGVPCGHEQWWNPQGTRADGLRADSSWCAVPDLSGFDGTIGHQVRDPLDVVSSLAQLPDHGPYIGCRETILGPLPADPVESAVAVYVGWNQACEKLTDFRWRVEDVDSLLIVELAYRAEVEVTEDAALTALRTVSKSTNDHGVTVRLGWGDLPDGPSTVALFDMAERYGYL